ncbi:TrpB-like pyridoxal phosphate-dependent enzyme [Streptomyces sp. ventii]|uniref:tryptophan synthase n=1 Tax=Streptomyces spiramenti TaxID=2720606 RepID=A0ABX1AL11_9ACTN|nr:TrpB-like pyridoxal phosphate-dependent enzyme [Streptomyces spiramenti]
MTPLATNRAGASGAPDVRRRSQCGPPPGPPPGPAGTGGGRPGPGRSRPGPAGPDPVPASEARRTAVSIDESISPQLPGAVPVPSAWLNFRGLLPEEMPPPRDREGVASLELAARIRLRAIREQERSREPLLPIPEEVRRRYEEMGRPTRLTRATALERHLGTPARIYLKREDTLPTGSFKLNSAMAQAYFASREGVRTLVTETGAGQWGHAVQYAARLHGLESIVFWSGVSARQKTARRVVLSMLGATVHESPSALTAAGRAVRASGRHTAGTLGTAIGDAVSYASEHPEVRYVSGSNLPHVLIHQSVIGLETRDQLAALGEEPDVLVAAVGGGSNLMGLMAPFLERKRARGAGLRLIGAESAAAPRLTRGTWRYDHADPGMLTPLSKSYTLGLDHELPETHVGGLRQHSGSTAVGVLRSAGWLEAVAYEERDIFETGRLVLRLEGFLPAPESCHALRAAIEEAAAARRPTVIVACVSGHGLLDVEGYLDAFPPEGVGGGSRTPAAGNAPPEPNRRPATAVRKETPC